MKMKNKDIAGAKARGFLTGDDVKILKDRAGERRICVTCGRSFKTPNQTGTRMFGCGCCALATNGPVNSPRARVLISPMVLNLIMASSFDLNLGA